MTSRTFTHAELHKSELNVRTNAEDAEATAALEASIERVGLMLPLLVHPAGLDAPTPWGVLAGGRRLLAIGRLIAAGKLPADWPIPARLVDGLPNAEITEMSLGENLLRRDLRPYEVHAAIAHAFAQGDSVETIAENLGQERDWVRRQLRLGKLAEPVFAAYAAGDLSFEQASAYAATEDTALQLSVYEALRGEHSYHHNAARIRAALKVGDREAARLLLFVGEAVYVGAGGMIEPDLFADGRDARVRITDEPLLRRLAEERFAVERERVRAIASRPDLRFVAQPPQFSGRTDQALEIALDPGKLPAHRFPTDAIVATIDVDDHGHPVTRLWWANRTAKGTGEKLGERAAGTPPNTAVMTPKSGEAFVGPDSAYAQNGRAIARDEYGLTADGLQLFRSLRRALLRRLLIEQGGTVARDYLVWSQARALVGHELPAQTGARAIAGEWHDGADRAPPGLFEGYAGDVPAESDWIAWVDMLKAQPFMTEKDPAKSLSLFLELDQPAKDKSAAIVAGMALLRSADTPGWRIAAHDVLAHACGVDAKTLRSWWTPTAKWIGLFGRLYRLGTAQRFVDAATHTGFIRLKDPDLTDATLTALDPANHRDPDARDHAERWLPDLLAFGPGPAPPPPAPAADPAREQREKVKKQLKGRANAARVREAVQ
jgi:ParB family chromosome partitioning protein